MRSLILDACADAEELTALLSSGAPIPIGVTGGSMLPTLKERRDTVWVRQCAPDTLRRGAIVFFRRTDGRFVLHRIRKITKNGIIVNGDAQSWCERIAPEQILGAVTHITRNGKKRSCASLPCRLWELLWYPTRPIRPALIRLRRLLHH